jgi:integrase
VRDEDGGKAPWAANTQATGAMVGGRLWRSEIKREKEAAEREERRPRFTVNPWDSVELREKKKTRQYFLSPAQWAAVRDASRGTPACALLAFGCLAGLRQQEAANLRPGIDVDLEGRVVHVQDRPGEKAWETKTPGSVRDVPMSEELVELVREHLAAGFATERYLFHGAGYEGPLGSVSVLAWTELAFTAGGVRYGRRRDSLTFHNLRHTFASWLVQGVRVAGPDGSTMIVTVDVLRVSKLLGNSVDEVIDTYGHLMPDNLADAVAMIDRKLGRVDPTSNPPADARGTGGRKEA